MATLTEVSVMSRKFIVWIVIAVVAFLVLRVLFGFTVSYIQSLNPPKPAAPNVLFGKIPPPQFPDTLKRTSGLNLNLLTIEGGPQTATDTGRVYLMPKKLPSLLAPQNARETALKLKFTGQPEILSSSLYVFRDTSRSFELDIVNNNFTYFYDYKSDPSIFASHTGFGESNVVEQASKFFSSTGIVDSSMLSKSNVQFLQYASSSGSFIPISNADGANAARVNYFRPDINSLPLLQPLYDQSYTYAIVTPSGAELTRIVEAEYAFWPIDTSNFGTYPLRTSDAAWKGVQNGEGVVATFGTNPENGEIIIREVYLGYYDSGLPETYLQPIFVFEGDNGFIAYIAALDPVFLDPGL